MTVRVERLGASFGRLDDAALVAVSRALALFLGIARQPAQPASAVQSLLS